MNIVIKVTSTVGSSSWEDGPGSLMNADSWRETHVVWEGCVSNDMDLSDAAVRPRRLDLADLTRPAHDMRPAPGSVCPGKEALGDEAFHRGR